MKHVKVVLIAVVLLMLPAYALPADLGYMRISLMEGDVQIKTPEAGDWGPASINGPVMEGDQLWVPDGARVELQLNSGTYVRLDQNSALQILSLDKDASQFYLTQGHAYVYFNAPRGVIQIDSPDASTRAFEKAIFRIDISDQYEYTDVAVYKGYVETENQLGTTRIKAGEMLSIGQNTNGEIAPMGPSDAWEGWNKKRNDRIFARKGASSRYLPAELSVYSSDFDADGRWVEVPDYGRCWTPRVVAGWAPYRDGRWIWRGDDYVWVSYDPWGWAPYHYGRWAFVARVGWCWVPPVAGEVYWGPGFVGWVRTGDYVAWVPLAPGEIYYGRGNYGRHSVNITTVNINQINITNVYRNVNAANGVTVVSRNTFATASPAMVKVDRTVIQQQLFTKNNISVGAPAIRPTRESYFATAKAIAPAKLPPQPLRNIQVKELKQSRPFIKEPNKSVLNPGAKPQALPVNTVATKRTPGKGTPTIQPVQPGGRAAPGGPAAKGERPQVKLPERKPGVPQGGPAPSVERPKATPPERKPAAPEGGLIPRGERPAATPPERKSVAPQGGPAPSGERPKATPPERKPVAPQGSPAPKGERPVATPPERKPLAPQGGPAPSVERPKVTPPERKPVAPEGRPAPQEEKKPAGPDERKKPEEPVR